MLGGKQFTPGQGGICCSVFTGSTHGACAGRIEQVIGIGKGPGSIPQSETAQRM